MTIPAGTLVPRDARDFGAYELIAKLATGGMAEIFLARPTGQASHDLLVLKRILPHLAEDEHFVTMFRDEADLAAQLLHPNVCLVHGFGEFAGTWYIAMEYLHGVALSRMMTRLSKGGKLLDIRLVAGIIIQACEGLQHAHDARGKDGALMGVVHRDVSPPNIMVAADGTVKLLDFGIAKARGANSKTRTGTVKGKNAYMSPEQILGKPLDRRSDVFALAVVMYELLAIKRLFHRDSDFMTFKAITEEPIPDIRERRPDIPAALRAALVQAMARDPNGRFDSAAAFAQAIRNAVAPLGGPAGQTELAGMLANDFGDEIAARDEILRAADEQAAAPNLGNAFPRVATTIGAPPAPPAPAPAVPIPARSGELAERQLSASGAASAQTLPAVPTMIVNQNRSGALSAPPAQLPVKLPESTQPQAPTQPLAPPAAALASATPWPPMFGIADAPTAPIHTNGANGTAAATGLPDFSGSMPADTWMADPSTNLLRAHRAKSLRNAVIAIVMIGIVIAVIVYVVNRSDVTPTRAPLTLPPDAALGNQPRPIEIDAAPVMSPQDIRSVAKYGFFSLQATAKTTVYLDDHLIGETPLTRLPIPPGIYKIKALGPHNKIKKLDITMYGGQDTDAGTITW